MKTNRFPSLLTLAFAFALACGGTAGLTLWAAEAKTAPKQPKSTSADKSEKSDAKSGEVAKPADDKRPPLKFNIDKKSINRDAADRVSYSSVVKRTAGSVVHVYSSKRVRAQDMYPFLNDPLFRRFFEVPGQSDEDDDAANRPQQKQRGGSGSGRGNRGLRGGGNNRVPEQIQQGLGSGIVVSADGYILTNNHVIEDADDVKVAIGESNKRYEAKVVGRDQLTDVAVLRIDAHGLVPATFGDSDQLEVGDVVLAIGNPFGVGQSVSRGIVSALSRGLGIGVPLEDFIQTDAAINPGNSGGALLDSEGRVVGINTAILSRSGGFAGVGFAIPINLVRGVAEQLVNKGRVDRGFLGVGPQDLTEDLTAQFGADKGALISSVEPETPAERAGLKSGDVITKVNDTEIRDARHLLLTISQIAPETEVSISYLREGKTHTTKTKLARRKDDLTARGETGGPAGKDVGVLNGVGVGDITPQLRDELQLPARIKGAIITNVDPDSPSARQGLREGDVILELDRKPVSNAEEAVKLSEQIKGPKVLVLIWRNGQRSYVVIDESKE
jgi:serine protease Do